MTSHWLTNWPASLILAGLLTCGVVLWPIPTATLGLLLAILGSGVLLIVHARDRKRERERKQLIRRLNVFEEPPAEAGWHHPRATR